MARQPTGGVLVARQSEANAASVEAWMHRPSDDHQIVGRCTKRPPQNKSIVWLRAVGGVDGVVPFAVESVGLNIDECELRI